MIYQLLIAWANYLFQHVEVTLPYDGIIYTNLSASVKLFHDYMMLIPAPSVPNNVPWILKESLASAMTFILYVLSFRFFFKLVLFEDSLVVYFCNPEIIYRKQNEM